MASVNCLYTTVQNVSGREAIFSFLPPHGRTMGIGEQLTVAGNLIDRLAVKTSNRQFQAMERALSAGLLSILATPSVFVYDDTIASGAVIDPKVIVDAAGVLGMAEPCYGPPDNPPTAP